MKEKTEDRHSSWIRSFGRRVGRKLSPKQQVLIEDLLPRLAFPVNGPERIDPRDLFPGCGEIWLEIGFGGGEHLVGQAARQPGTGFIGCEPFIDGVAKLLTAIDEHGLTNIRIHADDVRELLARLEPGSIDRVFILFPDPWPKPRHHKRRLVQPDFLAQIADVLSPDARVRFATDVRSYADEALVAFLADGRFAWQAECAGDWRCAPTDHIATRYEAKRLGDIDPVWFDFVFKPG